MGFLPSSDEMAEFMGVSAEDRARRRDAVQQKPGVMAQAATAVEGVLQRDVNARFMAARVDKSGENEDERVVETVTTITDRKKIRSRHESAEGLAAQKKERGGFEF